MFSVNNRTILQIVYYTHMGGEGYGGFLLKGQTHISKGPCFRFTLFCKYLIALKDVIWPPRFVMREVMELFTLIDCLCGMKSANHNSKVQYENPAM